MRKTTRKKSTTKKKNTASSVSIPVTKVKSSSKTSAKQTKEKSILEEGETGKKKKAVEGVKVDEKHSLPAEEKIFPVAKKEGEKKKMVNIKKRKWWKIPLIVLAVLVVLVAIAGIVYRFVFLENGALVPKDVEFTLNGPEQMVNGAETEYTISVNNKDSVDFEDVTVDMIYPDGFTPVSVSPESADFNETKWELKSLAKGASQTITIKGTLVGNVDDQKTVTARLSYKPRNVSSHFTEERVVKTKLEALGIEVDFTAPKSVTSGSEFTFNVAVNNTESFDLENLRVKMVYPAAFEFKSSSPRPDFDFDTFDIETLNEGEEELIKVKGVLTGKAKDQKKIQAVLGFVDDKNEFYPQIEKDVSIEIAKVVADISTKVFGKVENAMSPGEQLEYTVKYKNTGTEAFKNVTLETHLDTKLVNTESFEVDRGKVKDGVVIWDKETIPDLETVNAGDEGELTFKVRIADTMPVKDKDDINFEIKARSFFKAEGTEGNPEKSIQIESKNAITKINSLVTIRPEVHYYDFEGRKVGSGPLPPVASKKTTYRMYLVLSNTTNEVNEGIVEVSLPKWVQFTGSKSTNVGTLIVEDDQVIWTIGKIPAHTGQFSENIEAYVDVNLVPSVEDIGKTVELTKKIMFTGIDAYTDQDIMKTEPNVTSDLTDDPFALGKGEVLEKEVEIQDDFSLDQSEEGAVRGDDFEEGTNDLPVDNTNEEAKTDEVETGDGSGLSLR